MLGAIAGDINCWNKIGITGDKSCPLLKEVIHCRNCSVYSSAGRTLFQREAPAGYLEEWTKLLAQPLTEEVIKSNVSQKANRSKESATSVIIFRLKEEWFALPVDIIKEITQVFPIHTLPHRSNQILKGIVNIRGEIITCISLSNLLKLTKYKLNNKNNLFKISRMIVLEIQDNRWVFKVDEIDSVNRLAPNQIQNSPTALLKKSNTYTKKIIPWNNKKINYLDSDLLFYELLFYTYSRPQENLLNT